MTEGPSSKIDTHSLLARSMNLLGWDRVTSSLASHACSPYTHSFCLRLKPETEFQTAQKKTGGNGRNVGVTRFTGILSYGPL